VKTAAFRELKLLGDFNWSFNPSIQKKQLLDLAACHFIREARDVLLMGPPGVGKSFLVQALGYQAIKQGYVVLYRSRSTMMTSNRPLEDWGKLIGDVPSATAILDRFLHHAEIISITGKSYRLKDRAGGPTNETTRPTTPSTSDESTAPPPQSLDSNEAKPPIPPSESDHGKPAGKPRRPADKSTDGPCPS